MQEADEQELAKSAFWNCRSGTPNCPMSAGARYFKEKSVDDKEIIVDESTICRRLRAAAHLNNEIPE